MVLMSEMYCFFLINFQILPPPPPTLFTACSEMSTRGGTAVRISFCGGMELPDCLTEYISGVSVGNTVLYHERHAESCVHRVVRQMIG